MHNTKAQVYMTCLLIQKLDMQHTSCSVEEIPSISDTTEQVVSYCKNVALALFKKILSNSLTPEFTRLLPKCRVL